VSLALYLALTATPRRYVLLKERNLLQTERAAAKSVRERFQNPVRLAKVRKGMARIKLVLTERAIEQNAANGGGRGGLAIAMSTINQL
jgi:ribosomal protein L29